MARIQAVLIVLLMCLSSLTLIVPAAAADPGPMMEPMATEQRVVVTELFTGAQCGPCVNADLGLGDFLADHTRDEVVALVYHRPIPGADKLATTETATRHQWYSSGGTSTPNLWVDGKIVRVGGFSTRADGKNWQTTQFNTRKIIASQLNITTDGFISPSLTGTVWINVTALESPSISNLYLHTMIVRREYDWTAPNGVPEHHYVVRKMLPAANGEAISPTVGNTISKQYSFDLSSDGSGNDMWTVEDDMAVIAFVQTHTRTDAGSSRYAAEILQADYSNLRTVPNVPPVISAGHVELPDGATEDDTVTFKVFYVDVDNYANKEPVVQVSYKNATSGVSTKDMVVVASGVPWTEGKWMKYETKLAPGTYSYRFNASDGEDFALGDTLWNATTFMIKPRNKVPQLSANSYAPLEGDTNTKFRFDIMYRDGDNEAPVEAKIYINDVAYPMETDETDVFNDWVTYKYETTMPIGDNHRFYYMFSDGTDSVRLPAVDASPNWLRGPTVVKPNNAPTLTTALFSPEEGTRMDEFTFTIIYTDGENDHPTISYIYIDEVPNIMNPDGFDYENGVVFRYRTTLTMGEHSIRYLFNDGKHEVKFPDIGGTIAGPTVINMDPVGVIASPSDGVRYTPDQFVSFSAVGSEDPEQDPLAYTWTSSIDGHLSDQQAFDTKLTEGEHTITLEVTDEYGGSNTLSVDVLVKPKLPEPFVVRYVSSFGEATPVEQDMVRYTITLDNKGEAIAQGITVGFYVDDELVNTDTVSISVGNEVEVRFTWEAVLGLHDMRIEVPGDTLTFQQNVDRNSPPAVTPSINNIEDGQEAKFKTGEEVYFEAAATDENGDELTYLWDFGDGITANKNVASHIFAIKGTYDVKVTVTDARGGVTEETITVEIVKPKASGGDSPGFGAIVAIAAFMAVIVAVSRRRM